MSKEKPIQIRILTPGDLAQLYFTFLEAFADYSVDMHLDRKAFEVRMLSKLHIDWGQSIGAFSGDKMVGFIAHTSNAYQGCLTAYNGGTGVIPAYRGLGLTGHMYDLAKKQFRKYDIAKCVLEVIDSNTHALKAYTQIGFKKTRRLKCYKLMMPAHLPQKISFTVSALNTVMLAKIAVQVRTSFMDTLEQLSRNQPNEKMILCHQAGELIAYAIFNPANGRIGHLWVREDHRRRGVGASLMATAQKYCDRPPTVINVDETDEIAHQFLIACGFENQINQWEMLLQLD